MAQEQGFCGPSQGASSQSTQGQGSFCSPSGAQQGNPAAPAQSTGMGQTPAFSNSALCSESEATPEPSNLLATHSKGSPWDLPGRRWGS